MVWEPKRLQLKFGKIVSVYNRNPQESHLILIGYCCENGQLGVVYQLQPLDTVENLLIQDDFKWIARIKVALGFAHTLEVLHRRVLLLRNVDGNHIMVDKAFNPILFNFNMLVGGVFGGIPPKEYFWGRCAHVDPYICKSSKCLLHLFLFYTQKTAV